MKTIVVHQGKGEDALEMTIEVTNEEFEMMEEIRSKDPSLWKDRGFDLVKAAKEAVKRELGKTDSKAKRFNWKILLGIILGASAIIGTIIFAERRNKETTEKPTATTIADPKKIGNEETENIKKIYNKLIEWGASGTYEDFIAYFEESDENRMRTYEFCTEKGYQGTYEQFLEFAGYNFVFEANQNVLNLYDYLYDEKLFIGSVEDFKKSLMSEPYRNTLYQFLSEKQVFEGSYSLFNEELGLSALTYSWNNHKRNLFDILTLYNYDIGDYQTYSQKIKDESKRRILYDYVSKEYDLGSWEEFCNKLDGSK